MTYDIGGAIVAGREGVFLVTRDTARAWLPTLDLRRFDAEGDERGRFLRELRDAARTYGFFYLVGHGVDDRLIQSVLALSRRFFALPEAKKLEIEMVNSPHFRGYTRAGFEYTRGRQDWREQVDIGAERPVLALDPGSPAWKRLQGPNQWPSTDADLTEILGALVYHNHPVGQALIDQIRIGAEDLKLVKVLDPDTDPKTFAERVTVDILA